LLTGKAIVALDFFPGQPGYVRDEEVTGLVAIPTVPSRIDQAADLLRDLADGLRAVPLKETLEAANRTMESLDRLLSSSELEGSIGQFSALLGNLDAVARQLDQQLPVLLGNLNQGSEEFKQALTGVHQ